MPEPTSARADRARSSMSKTKARRQAHRESAIFRREDGWHLVTSRNYFRPLRVALDLEEGISYADARRALAAWRAERVRELTGVTDRSGAVTDLPTSCAPR